MVTKQVFTYGREDVPGVNLHPPPPTFTHSCHPVRIEQVAKTHSHSNECFVKVTWTYNQAM
jgi:hypothetical protein